MNKMLLFCLMIFYTSTWGQTFTKIYSPEKSAKRFFFYRMAAIPGEKGWYATGSQLGDAQSVIVRFDPEGNVVWAKMPSDQRSVNGLSVLDNGDVLVFNHNTSFGDFSNASVLRLSDEGSFLSEDIWTMEASAEAWTAAKRLGNGEVLAIGNSVDPDNDNDRLLMAKFSPDGQLLWEKVLSHESFGYFSDIIEIPENKGFYITATKFVSIGKNLTALLRFDKDGNVMWAKVYDFGAKTADFQKGLLYPDGSVLFTGSGQKNGFSDNYILLFKTDAAGNPIWAKGLDGLKNINVYEPRWADPQTIVIDACTWNQVFPIVDNDNLIIRINTEGELTGTMAFGSNTQDFLLNSLQQGDQLLLCGTTYDGSTKDSTRAYISRTDISTSRCAKTYDLTPLPDGVPLPSVTTLTVDELDPLIHKTHTATMTDIRFKTQTSCTSVSTRDETDLCREDIKNNTQTLYEQLALLSAYATQTSLQVYDLTGRLVQDLQNPVATNLNFPFVPGLYFYTLAHNACGAKQTISGKLLVAP